MTNNEIDKLLNMLDNNNLEQLKKYLLTEKSRNTSILRQKTFEKYLTTNFKGINDKTIPKIYFDDSVQSFTNGVSIYIINKNLLNTKAEYLKDDKNSKRTTGHRYQIVSKDEMNAFLEKVKELLGDFYFDIDDFKCSGELKNLYYNVEYYDGLYEKTMTDIFSRKEIDTADILLNYPKYKIYNQTPIIVGESEIGKVYILGYKRK